MDLEFERQATAFKCWTDFSHSAIRFQLAKFWLNSSSVCSMGLSVFLTRVAPYLLPHARPHLTV
jgi:hypothetical protein